MSPLVWTIAGSDSSGCAGIQTDLKTFQSFGVHGCSIITAITAQNTKELDQIFYVPNNIIAAQINSLQNNLKPKAIKIGMFSQKAIIDLLSIYTGLVVLDPLITSTSGKNLFSGSFLNHLAKLKKVFPFVDLLTPNLLEAEKIVGYSLSSYQAIQLAARDILRLGVKSVLIKGGHFKDMQFSQDYWTNGSDCCWIASKKKLQKKMRGIGCTLSSAITACLALGYAMKDAIVLAKMYVNQGMRLTNETWLIHKTGLQNKKDFPYLTMAPINNAPKKFLSCGRKPLGLYPIVDSTDWLKKLLPVGITTIQLRIKNKEGLELENAIRTAIELAKKHNIRLFINDYWELAIQYGAYGVHLGQEDLNNANVEKIRKAGLRLGISSHCYYEAARAHAISPSYIAFGPVFQTFSKKMRFPAQGIEKLKRWQQILDYPIVAIGGIDLEKLPQVLKTNVNGVAMISGITQVDNPIAQTQQLLERFYESNRR